MSSEATIDEMWNAMEEYGIDRRLLESTNPSDELLFRLYQAIRQVKEKTEMLERENNEFLNNSTDT